MRITFCGGAGEVGASCILVRIDGKNILLDCGIRMGGAESLPDLRRIQEAGALDAIVASHAHMDHTGSLPVVSTEYPGTPIYMTPATRDITRVLLYDSLKIMDREEEIPAYAETHVEQMLQRITCFSFQCAFKPIPSSDIEIELYPAGHILGAACVYLRGDEGSLLYSGDFSAQPQKTVEGARLPHLRPDVMITEATYGNLLHADRKTEEERLIDTVRTVIDRQGKVLIPAFAVGRAQEVILLLRSAQSSGRLPEVPVYVDGMVRQICRIYADHPQYVRPALARRIWKHTDIFYSDTVTAVTSRGEREAIAASTSPCIIVSSSGMLTGGPSAFYALHLAGDKRNFIAVTGYQDEESPGRRLMGLVDSVESEKTWRVGDTVVPVSAELGKYNLSAHSDKTAILGLVHRFAPGKTFFVHGNSQALGAMGEAVGRDYHRELYIPANGETYDLELRRPRKQIPRSELRSLNTEVLPGEADLEALWSHLLGEEVGRGITVEQIMHVYSGRRDFAESEVTEIAGLLNASPLFKTDARRLFLYLPVSADEVKAPQTPGVMEVNEMLALARTFFPDEAGLYRTGARFEEKVVLVFFDFPALAMERYAPRIQELEERTGWTVEANTNVNQVALHALISRVLKRGTPAFVKAAFYPTEDRVRAVFTEEPANLAALSQAFEDASGIVLCPEYPGMEPETEEAGETERMEQNQALALIAEVFAEADDRLYKKGIKSDERGRHIELSFISRVIGEKYAGWIRDIEKESGWRVRISPNPNQAEILQLTLELLSEAGITPVKNPGLHLSTSSMRVRLAAAPDETAWQGMSTRLEASTGFTLDYEVG